MTNPRIPFELSSSRKRYSGPDEKSLIVHVVVNIEHWLFDSPMPRKIITAPHGAENVPDVPNYSWAEYGMRCGLPRMIRLFSEYGIPVSASVNAGVIEAYPEIAESILEAGWEFIGHGMHQKSMQAEQDEASLIYQAIEKIENFTGKKLRGWLSPGLKQTQQTPDILKLLGIDYVCDWVLDDLPAWITSKHGPLLAMPYNIELNDSIIYAIEKHSSPEMYRRVKDSVSVFEKELRNPTVMALGLHPHLMGVAHRFSYLQKMIEDLSRRQDSIFMNGSQIADWFYAAEESGK